MSGRYFGRAVVGDPVAGMRTAPIGVAGIGVGLLAAALIEPGALDSLSPGEVWGAFGLHVAVLALVGGWELFSLIALLRKATPADDVAASEDGDRVPGLWAQAGLFAGVAVVVAGLCVAFDNGAALVVGGAALGLGGALAVAVPKLLIRRRERRLGRRYFRTSGEPEKIVWTTVRPTPDRLREEIGI